MLGAHKRGRQLRRPLVVRCVGLISSARTNSGHTDRKLYGAMDHTSDHNADHRLPFRSG
jgi:hypothetical protein